MNSCIVSRLLASLNVWLTITAFLGAILGVAAVIALGVFIVGLISAPVLTPAIVGALAATVFAELIPLAAALVAGSLLLAIGFLINDLLQCFVFSALPPPNPPRPPGMPLTGVPTCDTAKQDLDAGRAAAALAEQAVNDQAARVRRAQDRLSGARSALSAATVAVGASILVPWLLIPAVGALAAAGVAVRAASVNLAQETQNFLALAAALSQKQRELAELETMVKLACSTPPSSGNAYPLSITIQAMSVVIGISPPPQPPRVPVGTSPGNTVGG